MEGMVISRIHSHEMSPESLYNELKLLPTLLHKGKPG